MRTRMSVGLVVLLFGVGAAGADELSELKEQVQQLQQKIEKLEAKQQQQDAAIENKVSEAVEAKQLGALPEGLEWATKVKWSGDLRYRHEEIEAEGDDKDDRHRNRIRARLGLEAKIDDEWDLGFRISSGSADPVSTNQTLGDGFSTKDFRLDLAYFDWHPGDLSGLNVIGGKMKNPFYKPGKSELIWDGDLNPEGIAAQYNVPLAERSELFANAGGFWAEESSAGVDQGLWGAQAGVKHYLDGEQSSYVLGGASFFDYGNLAGNATLYDDEDGFGNTVSTVGDNTFYQSDYDVAEVFGEYGTKVGGMPVAVFGNYAENTAAATDEDAAWLLGCKLNKAKSPGSWEFRYNYRDVEADSVLGVFSDSDFIGGGTDGKGHELGLNYMLARHIQAGLTYFINERNRSGIDDADYRRLQADIKFKF